MYKNWLIINISNNYFLKVGNKVFRCQIGAGGFESTAKKIEGDKTTPIGKWRLEKLYYRPDRVLRPKSKKKNILRIKPITKYCGWCDDIRSKFYNKYLNINNLQSTKIGFEKLWREDNAYDIVIQISYNTNPIIKNKGSICKTPFNILLQFKIVPFLFTFKFYLENIMLFTWTHIEFSV